MFIDGVVGVIYIILFTKMPSAKHTLPIHVKWNQCWCFPDVLKMNVFNVLDSFIEWICKVVFCEYSEVVCVYCELYNCKILVYLLFIFFGNGVQW